MPIRDAIRDLPASRIAEISALGMGDPAVIPLWYGEGDLPTPAFIGAAATAALQAGQTFYTYKAGLPELRATIADYLSGLYARPTAAERIAVTSSGMTGADAGRAGADRRRRQSRHRRAGVAEHRRRGLDHGRRAAPRRRSTPPPGGGWRLDLERLFAACDARTRGIFVNSPSNPTGWVISPDEIAALLAFARRRGLWLIADEVYGRIVYGNRAAPSFLDQAEPDDRLIVVNSFSKSWAMTGWRLGWLTVPPDLLARRSRNWSSSTPAARRPFCSMPAIVAIRDGEPFHRRASSRAAAPRAMSRSTRCRPAGGSRWRGRAGAFYAFLRVDGMTDSLAFAKEVLHTAKVGPRAGQRLRPDGRRLSAAVLRPRPAGDRRRGRAAGKRVADGLCSGLAR